MKTLIAHRKSIRDNPSAYSKDIDRLESTLINHIKRCGYKKAGQAKAQPIRQEIVRWIMSTQDGLPLFHVDGDLPFCWNAPQYWDINYIRYEWGHLNSVNQNTDADRLDNLALLSARCNQHVQTSMDISEVKAWLRGSAIAIRIDDVLEKRRELFNSQSWIRLLERLEEFR